MEDSSSTPRPTNRASLPPQAASFDLLQAAIDAIPDPLFVKDLQHRWVACNQALSNLLGGLPREKIIGYTDADYIPREQYEVFWQVDDAVIATGKAHENEEVIALADGIARTLWTRKFPVKDADERIIGVCVLVIDITASKQRQLELERLAAELAQQQRIIETQAAMLEEIGTPVIQVRDKILLIPLIGTLDSRRASHVVDTVLHAINRANAQVIILDITGVATVDTSVASYLIRAVQAAKLLGCHSLLVGISPEIAQTLVGLGINFSDIATYATLQQGLEEAMGLLV